MSLFYSADQGLHIGSTIIRSDPLPESAVLAAVFKCNYQTMVSFEPVKRHSIDAIEIARVDESGIDALV